MTPPKITLIVGLPGSGKSTFCRKLAIREGIARGADDDDFLRSDLRPPFGFTGVIARLKAGERCIVNDVTLSTAKERQPVVERLRREVPKVEIEWVCFENRPEQCAQNVRADSTRTVPADVEARLRTIRERTRDFEPPAGCTFVEVYAPPNA